MIETSGKKLAGPIIRLHPNDNVVVARVDVGIGTEVPSEHFTSRSQVPAGYKIASQKILKGEPILKYNVTACPKYSSWGYLPCWGRLLMRVVHLRL